MVNKYCNDVSTILVGNPLIKKEGCFKNSGVLIILDHQLYLKENIEMLNILNNSGVLDIYNDQVFVKLHPMDDIDNYKSNILKKYNIIMSLDNLFFSLVIGHTSSLLYIRGCQGENILRYKSKIPAIDLGVEFINQEGFIEAYKTHSSKKIDTSEISLYYGKESSIVFNECICEILNL